jgi:hypothetical protein
MGFLELGDDSLYEEHVDGTQNHTPETTNLTSQTLGPTVQKFSTLIPDFEHLGQMSLVKCKILLGEVCMFYTRMPQDNSLLNLTECSYTAKDEWLDKHRPYTVVF